MDFRIPFSLRIKRERKRKEERRRKREKVALNEGCYREIDWTLADTDYLPIDTLKRALTIRTSNAIFPECPFRSTPSLFVFFYWDSLSLQLYDTTIRRKDIETYKLKPRSVHRVNKVSIFILMIPNQRDRMRLLNERFNSKYLLILSSSSISFETSDKTTFHIFSSTDWLFYLKLDGVTSTFVRRWNFRSMFACSFLTNQVDKTWMSPIGKGSGEDVKTVQEWNSLQRRTIYFHSFPVTACSRRIELAREEEMKTTYSHSGSSSKLRKGFFSADPSGTIFFRI